MIRNLIIALCALSLYSSYVTAASIYVYVNKQGNKLITDHVRTDLAGYSLLRKYRVDDHSSTVIRPAGKGRVIKTRPSDYDRLIVNKAQELGLEPALLKAMIHIESAFNPNALSPKGASGLMQLMPETAKRYGVFDRTDPVESLDGGGRYMRDLLFLFGHDIELALAAYNAGENAVKRYNGIPPYRETENYVKKVIALRDQYRKQLIGT